MNALARIRSRLLPVTPSTPAALSGALLLAVAAALATPGAAAAQDKIYDPGNLSTMPNFANKKKAARKIQESYPPKLKNAGVSGKVQLQFVVKADGAVDPGSVQVLASDVSALAKAAKKVIKKIQFDPGQADGSAVATRVVFPISYGG